MPGTSHHQVFLLVDLIIVHSLIGGTGGGLGSSIIEAIRDEFPTMHITSITVGPFVSGESPLQHYNGLLTLAWLQRSVSRHHLYSLPEGIIL